MSWITCAAAGVCLPLLDLGQPLVAALGLEVLQRLAQHGLQVTKDAQVNRHAFVEFGAVYINVHLA
jgi:hypothetical protein